MLTDLSDAARRALAGASPSVVLVTDGRRRGCGVVFADGLVVTNAHNVSGTPVTVVFADGSRGTGTPTGIDADSDLAVIQLPTAGISSLEVSTQPPAVGDVVFPSHGAPRRGARLVWAHHGNANRLFRAQRPADRWVDQHSTPLPRRPSGSPLVDGNGRLIGINTHRPGDGFYQAIAATDRLAADLADLSVGKPLERRRLGVGLAPAGVAKTLRRAVGLPEHDGVLVRRVEVGSPAEAAGLPDARAT